MKDISDTIAKGAQSLSENKYFVGCIMITLAIGGRFIIDELNDDLRKLISNKLVRRTVIFCSFFMATRDVLKAFLLTMVFVILINELLVFDEEDDEDGKLSSKKKGSSEKGGSFNKGEIEKVIGSLKNVQMNM